MMKKILLALIGSVISAIAVLGTKAIEIFWGKSSSNTPTVVMVAAPDTSSSGFPAETPQPLAKKIAIPSSCTSTNQLVDTIESEIVGIKCIGSSGSAAPPQHSGPDYVSELSVDEFLDQAIRNSKLIDSYLIKVNGSTEAEAAANYHNMRSVVEFAEFLHLNLENLRSYVGNAPDLEKAIQHGENIEQYRAQLSRY